MRSVVIAETHCDNDADKGESSTADGSAIARDRERETVLELFSRAIDKDPVKIKKSKIKRSFKENCDTNTVKENFRVIIMVIDYALFM